MNRRWLLWIPLLCGAAWLVVFGDTTSAEVEASVSVAAPTVSDVPRADNASQAGDTVIPREQLIAAATADPSRDLFAARSWTPAIAASAGPPEAPVAPALPFTFLGKKLEGQSWEIYLARGEQTWIVKAGAVIDGTYRVDSADPPQLVMTYLPLGQSQTLPIGDAQ